MSTAQHAHTHTHTPVSGISCRSTYWSLPVVASKIPSKILWRFCADAVCAAPPQLPASSDCSHLLLLTCARHSDVVYLGVKYLSPVRHFFSCYSCLMNFPFSLLNLSSHILSCLFPVFLLSPTALYLKQCCHESCTVFAWQGKWNCL